MDGFYMKKWSYIGRDDVDDTINMEDFLNVDEQGGPSPHIFPFITMLTSNEAFLFHYNIDKLEGPFLSIHLFMAMLTTKSNPSPSILPFIVTNRRTM